MESESRIVESAVSPHAQVRCVTALARADGIGGGIEGGW